MRSLLAALLATGLIGIVQHDPFFWDSIQFGSKHADFYFAHGMTWSTLPAELDSGHPPLFGYYIAACWYFFGKSLEVSHWAMWPFVFGIFILLMQTGRRIIGPEWGWWLLPIALLDPVMAGQMVLVSPDNVLIFSFLLTIYGLFSVGRGIVLARILCALGCLGLCLISMRGMMTAGALFLCAAWLLSDKKILLSFLPGFGAAFAFLIWHYLATGWIGHHPDSSWWPAFEPATGAALLKNIAVIAWRWLDFGRIGEWLILSFLLYKGGTQVLDRQWIKTILVLLICLIPTAVLYQNLSAHRYFLPLFLGFHFLVLRAWATYMAQRQVPAFSTPKRLFTPPPFALLTIVLFFAWGNFWIYPRGVSMDWDSTLAHLSYHQLRRDACIYLDAQKIDYQAVGSAFPNLNSEDYLLLNGNQRRFAEYDTAQNRYVLASNVFNDLNMESYQAMQQRGWKVLKHWEHAGVWMELWGAQ